jgi:hypothetical protein
MSHARRFFQRKHPPARRKNARFRWEAPACATEEDALPAEARALRDGRTHASGGKHPLARRKRTRFQRKHPLCATEERALPVEAPACATEERALPVEAPACATEGDASVARCPVRALRPRALVTRKPERALGLVRFRESRAPSSGARGTGAHARARAFSRDRGVPQEEREVLVRTHWPKRFRGSRAPRQSNARHVCVWVPA